MSLVEMPFFVAVAKWVWGANPSHDVTPEICLGNVPFIGMACFECLIVKALGIVIILGSFLNKTPIMMNVMSSKSATGLSLASFYGEAIVYSNAAFYGLLSGYPMTAYGENIALLLQTFVLVVLTWQLQEGTPVPMQQRIMAVAVYAVYCISLLTLLPEEMYYLIQISTYPILLYARGSQVLKTFEIKHTGAQSIVTIIMSLVGGSIRILTTIKEVGWDMTMLFGYSIGVSLSFAMFIQYFLYQSNTEKFRAELRNKKQE